MVNDIKGRDVPWKHSNAVWHRNAYWNALTLTRRGFVQARLMKGMTGLPELVVHLLCT